MSDTVPTQSESTIVGALERLGGTLRETAAEIRGQVAVLAASQAHQAEKVSEHSKRLDAQADAINALREIRPAERLDEHDKALEVLQSAHDETRGRTRTWGLVGGLLGAAGTVAGVVSVVSDLSGK